MALAMAIVVAAGGAMEVAVAGPTLDGMSASSVAAWATGQGSVPQAKLMEEGSLLVQSTVVVTDMAALTTMLTGTARTVMMATAGTAAATPSAIQEVAGTAHLTAIPL